QDLNPFPGLTTKPTGVACEQAREPANPRPEAPPPLMVATRGRPREVDPPPSGPHATGSYDGWVGLGHIRANGHPSGGRWRPCHGLRGQGYCLETQGTPRHGQHVPPERLVWAVGAWAAGLGMRAVAQGFEVDPNTVR